MSTNKLRIKQLDKQLKKTGNIKHLISPTTGWINTIRTALGMSLQQVANRLNVSPQNIGYMEQREKEGSVTLKSMKEVANAMEMDFVYAFIPKDGSLENLIRKKAQKAAEEIVAEANQNMLLEDQEVYEDRLDEAIKERMEEIIYKMPKFLWD